MHVVPHREVFIRFIHVKDFLNVIEQETTARISPRHIIMLTTGRSLVATMNILKYFRKYLRKFVHKHASSSENFLADDGNHAMGLKSLFDSNFDDLPDPKRVWVGKAGSQEEGLGKLALLTPRVVAQAAKEIRTGKRVTLGWELTKLELANLNRQPCQHHIISLLNGLAFDDVYIMNPRGSSKRKYNANTVHRSRMLTVSQEQSSQWDGLRHFSQATPSVEGKPAERLFYGGTTASEILDRSNNRIGMQHWAREGIVGKDP